jgi:hypothetical protein
MTPVDRPAKDRDSNPINPASAYSPDLNKAATLRLGLMLAEIDERTVLGPLGSQLGGTSVAAGS